MSNRSNQDKYDVIQAQEEWRQMTSSTPPVQEKRTVLSLTEDQLAEIMAKIDSLQEEVKELRKQIEDD